MKLSHQLVLSSLAVLVLTACSNDPAERRQAKNDFKYLDSKLADSWNLPADAQPEFYPQYTIPEGEFAGQLGKDVDIRPPQQVLELIPGARAEDMDGNVALWLARGEEVEKVWQTMHAVGQERKVTFLRDDGNQVETDWIDLSAEDEEVTIAGRYRIEKVNQNNRQGIQFSLIEWRQDNKVIALTPELQQRYSRNLVNLVTSQYDKQLREEARLKAQQLIKRIPISMGQDRSGLPVIIARAPYEVMWEKLADTLPRLGFSIEERNRSQGSIDVQFDGLDEEVWQQIGVKPLSIEQRDYTLLVGDLGNRTSINVTNAQGKPIDESQLQGLIPALVALFEAEGDTGSESSAIHTQQEPISDDSHVMADDAAAETAVVSEDVNPDEAKQIEANRQAQEAAKQQAMEKAAQDVPQAEPNSQQGQISDTVKDENSTSPLK